MTKFSIIVPYHNSPETDRRAYMDELLASIPDRSDLEILLVDDHSSLPYVPSQHFEDTALRLVSNKPGRRYAGSARNTGIELAAGEYLIFADSDDRFIPGPLAAALDSIQDNASIDLCLFGVSSFLEDGTVGDRHLHVCRAVQTYGRTSNPDSLIQYHAPWGKILRADFIRRHTLAFGSERMSEDVVFGVTLALRSPRTCVIEKVAYEVRQGNSSLTAEISPDAVRIRLEVARQVHRILLAHGKGELRAPLHYHFRQYFAASPRVVLQQLLSAILAGERVVSPPGKMLRTLTSLRK